MLRRSGFRPKRPAAPPNDRESRLSARAERALASVAPRAARVDRADIGNPTSVQKAVKAKPGKRAPTVEEAAWMAAIVAHGCICCIMDGQEPRPTAVHHILRGGRRIGHLFSLPACDPGHHQSGAPLGLISRHPYKAQWEARYGTEMELLALVRERLNWREV